MGELIFTLDLPSPQAPQETHHEKAQSTPPQENGSNFTLDGFELSPDSPKRAVISPEKIAQNIRLAEAQEGVVGDPDAAIDAVESAQMYDAVPDNIFTDTLIDDDFPFDESQLAAIKMVAQQQYACMTGAAGTGKTTCTKAIIKAIMGQIGSVNLKTYWKSDKAESTKTRKVSAIALCAYTGRATQMIKRNFPESWHANIMTIHRLLAYQPEFYEEMDEESGSMRRKMRFVPTYTKSNKMPWDAIVIDEGGMLSLELYGKLWDACKPGCRIIMIGDINQLPPVHGTSIFGYAMIQWPTAELTHIHRQKGKENPIVENAWRILQGRTPVSGPMFQLVEVSSNTEKAAETLRGVMVLLEQKGIYEPLRDTVITATNGNVGSRGYAIGQLPLNEQLAFIFNPDGHRLMIDAGRERKDFAIGDKVMVTRNDHSIGITNGMTGVVSKLELNPNYMGDLAFVGDAHEVDEALREHGDGEQINKVDFLAGLAAQREEDPEARTKRERGYASHIVTIQFSDDLTAQFGTFAEVASLQVAYVITCHKSQGGEYHFVMIMCHDAHKFMLYREWLYTAVTRSSEKVLMFYNKAALAGALNKQRIKGSTLPEKIQAFIGWEKSGLKKIPELPAPSLIEALQLEENQ